MTENNFAFPGVLRQVMARFAVSVANLEYTPQEEELKNGRMEEWKLGSACAPSRTAAGSPSTSADFNLGPGPKLNFDGENFNFGPGPRLKSKSVKISFNPAIPAIISAICCKPACYW